MNFIQQVSNLITKKERKLFLLLFLLSFFVSIFETISISAIMFFISTVTNFNLIEKTRYYHFLYSVCRCSSPQQFMLFLGITVCGLYFCRAVLNIFHIFATSKLSLEKGRMLALRMFDEFLSFHYKDFTSKNSAEIAQAIFNYSGAFAQVCLGFLNLFSESLTILSVYLMLIWVNFKMTVSLTIFLCMLVFFVIKLFSKKLSEAGKQNQRFSLEQGKIFTEAFCNFKLIKLHGNGVDFMRRFDVANYGIVSACIFNNVLQSLPRFFLETLGFFILVVMIVYIMFFYMDPAFIIPIISIYALAFYRFLPSINKILSSYNQIVFNKPAVGLLIKHLETKPEHLENERVKFKGEIELKALSFYYKPDNFIFNKINMKICKGQRVAFVGPSGSGKSTLADLIMGIQRPQSGCIVIDDQVLSSRNIKNWRMKIGYIPQQIYLFDGTVVENVVFGRDYEKQRVISVLKKANIYDFLLTQDGLQTNVGEAGVKLSGGQKQRIAIARALYDDPEVMVLDEATSALDSKTEDLIMNEIYKINEDKTLIIIAHRLSTIKKCNIVYNVEDKRVTLIRNDDLSINRERLDFKSL